MNCSLEGTDDLASFCSNDLCPRVRCARFDVLRGKSTLQKCPPPSPLRVLTAGRPAGTGGRCTYARGSSGHDARATHGHINLHGRPIANENGQPNMFPATDRPRRNHPAPISLKLRPLAPTNMRARHARRCMLLAKLFVCSALE